jgi:hypothetical protein
LKNWVGGGAVIAEFDVAKLLSWIMLWGRLQYKSYVEVVGGDGCAMKSDWLPRESASVGVLEAAGILPPK